MTRFLTCLVALSLAAQAAAQSASDWPQFLGPHRNGLSSETGLIETWPQDGPREVWRVKGGVGMSGLAVSRGRLVTMVQSSGKQNVICLQAKTGKTIWQTPVAPQYENPQGDGPRATPTIAGDLVLTFTGEGALVALRLADGGVVWSRDVVAELGGKRADYGMASSPLVVENMTVVHVGAPQATVAAYDTRSGEPLWTSGKAEAAGYSSPQWLDVGGRRQVVSFTGGSVQGLAAETGDVLWRHPYVTDFHCNIAAPLAYDGRVFISAGENHGSVLLDLKPQGETFQVSEVWSSQGTGSVLRNEWQTSILLDGHLYGFDNVGSAGPVSHLTCVDAATGRRVWQQPRFGKGNMIAADGKLFVSTMKGELVVVKASPDGYQEIGRVKVLGSTRQAPALSGGLLFLRDDREIVCVSVQQP